MTVLKNAIFLLCAATSVFTFLGGYVALKAKSKLYLVLGFSAGAVIGLAFFDLLPTALELSAKAYSQREIAAMAGVGFFIYYIIDWAARKKNDGGLRGNIPALFLSFHSFLDGVTIGLAFKVSAAVGLLVAIAVIIHDFADGVNTTNVITRGKGSYRSAILWLVINSVAPLLGAGSTFYFQLTNGKLGVVLALIAGSFLYLGASDFIPESRLHPSRLQILLMTLIGAATMFIALCIAP